MIDINQKTFKYFVYYPVVLLKYENFPLHLKKLLVTQYLPLEKLREIQLSRLKDLLGYVKEHVPYYEECESDISQNDIREIEDIEGLPFITKALTKESPHKLISKENFRGLTKKTTGGSTGEPVTIWKTPYAMGKELAATWRGYSWAGIEIGDRQGRFWGVPYIEKDKQRAKLTDFICNRKRCSAFSFDEQSLKKYTEELSMFNPVYFYGYVSMLAEYARFFRENNTKPPFKLRSIVSTSEVLSSYHREIIEDVFDVKVFNEYGSGELGTIGHECEKGSMHISAENMIVEVLDGDRICKEGEVGELVVTELNNRAMPLIRYRTGDFASLSYKACPCGRSLPIIEHIAGRAYDMVLNKDGRTFHGEFFMYIFEEAKRKNLGIAAFQVIQLEINKIKVKIKPEAGYGVETETLIEDRIRSGFSSDVVLEFEKVESIPREASGKMRLIVGMNKG